ncbi:DUF1330 domain-containing protein [Terasakiella sp. SH-1]|uniref:DUF1330 domain-containing protein n=1 Tax=Terasakiella sp. SH-1 TaxID=2560057 RepID=UPI001430B278|nr:DUF1330 domain-containing protein [Terasakiella sp. SH-1]
MPAAKVYSIVDVEILDPALFQKYVDGHQKTLEPFGGRFLVAGGNFDVIEGDWTPKTVVIHEWPNREAFQKWYNSDDYTPWKQIRHQAAKANVIVVDGL